MNLDNIVEIILEIRNRITPDSDPGWTRYNNASEIIKKIDDGILLLKNGNLEALNDFDLYFGPTGVFQEVSIANGWGEEFIEISERWDLNIATYKK